MALVPTGPIVPNGPHVSPQYSDYGPRPRDPELYDTTPVHERVVQVLRAEGLEVNDYESNSPEPYQWTVKFDDSVKADDMEPPWGYGYAPVEITTPVLRFNRSSTFNSFWEIHRMLMALTSAFYIFVNDTCGLHVHVGAISNPHTEDYLYSRGFPIKTLRNFCQLLTLCEPEMNAIHPPSRLHNSYGGLPSQLLRYNGNAAEVLDQCRDFAEINWVWMGRGLEETDITPCLHMDSDDFYLPAYHIGNLIRESDYSPTERSRRTIEFRQHIGTFQYEDIYHWVKLVVRILQFSHECGPQGLPASLISAINDERANPGGRFNTEAFLRAIGAGEQADFYRTRMYIHPRPAIFQVYHPAAFSSSSSSSAPAVASSSIDPNILYQDPGPSEPEWEAWPLMEFWPDGPYAEGGEDEVPDIVTMNYRDLTHRNVEY